MNAAAKDTKNAKYTKNSKILSLDDMARESSARREAGRRTVLAHGCFDLLHIGHIRYLEAARKFGDSLFVTVTPDRFVDKGPNRPVFNESLRAEALASLSCVDFVAVNDGPTAEELLRRLRPHIYVKGSDFAADKNDPTGKLQAEAARCAELGVEMRFTEDIVFSSSNLINRFLSDWPEELREYLRLFRSRHTLPEIVKLLDAMGGLSVCLAGDAILDEYCYCSPLGMSSKSPTLAVLQTGGDLYAGGVLAIANHLAGLVREVHLVTVLGEGDSREEFISGALRPNVRPHYFYQPGAPTVKKTRFIEGYSSAKLLEIYHMAEAPLPAEREAALRTALARFGAAADLTLAADFGHGALSQAVRDDLCASGVFLAVNTQSNAGNRMMHTISRYSRADCVCLTESELRLDLRDSAAHVRHLLPEAARRLEAGLFLATRGKKGCCLGRTDGYFVEVPAFAVKVVDAVGAGDALFAAVSLAARLGADPELAAFLGNAAGALAVQSMGNAKPLDRQSLEKALTAMLK